MVNKNSLEESLFFILLTSIYQTGIVLICVIIKLGILLDLRPQIPDPEKIRKLYDLWLLSDYVSLLPIAFSLLSQNNISMG